MEEFNNVEKYDLKKTNKSLIITTILFIISTIMFFIVDLIDHYSFAINKLEDLVSSIKWGSLVLTIGLILLFVVQLISKGYKTLSINKTIANILEFVVIVPCVVVIYTYVFTFGLTFATVDGISMNNTLSDGDEVVLFYNKDLEKNRIVVIDVNKTYYDYDAEKAFIKRIVGMPGDNIQMVKKENYVIDLYINGVFIESYTESMKLYNELPLDENGYFKFFYFDENHIKHETLTIPEGYYFVMGDNRSHSNDSRSIGLVRYEDIIGTVKYRTKDGSMFNWEALK